MDDVDMCIRGRGRDMDGCALCSAEELPDPFSHGGANARTAVLRLLAVRRPQDAPELLVSPVRVPGVLPEEAEGIWGGRCGGKQRERDVLRNVRHLCSSVVRAGADEDEDRGNLRETTRWKEREREEMLGDVP